ncbi:type II toxin-antitoxin system HipA family toxin [Legionella saoudiensis]|uniref:type II toxin-antitoxin system HipA family toxin n=1 Tax=Legionella saoudiensis TaxID=1750561 RepID=UPI00072FBF8C|nr:type II toxin-antitoxin system HipA family toxin [Legionella saoudiensis]
MSGLRNGKAIKFKPLTEQKIASILRNYRINPLGMSSEEEDFRISIAGAQEKSAFLYHEKQWCEPLQETPTTLEEILKKTDFVINEVSKLIPEGFPAYICDPIFQGIMKAKQKLE